MTWLRRIGWALLAALSFILPGLGWLRERRLRKQADARWKSEVAINRRQAEINAGLSRVRDRRDQRIETIAARRESERAPIIAEARVVHDLGVKAESGDDGALDELAAKLNEAK